VARILMEMLGACRMALLLLPLPYEVEEDPVTELLVAVEEGQLR
jgi:hypothetical protein